MAIKYPIPVLLDTCISVDASRQLETAGHDVIWAGDWHPDPGDEAILRAAHEQQRVLITLDKDFGELGVLRRLPHYGILRLLGFRATEQGSACQRVLAAYADDLRAGGILVVEPTRVRIRRKFE